MADAETIKAKAKSKVVLLTMLFCCVLLCGGIWEYQKAMQPLAQTTLIYKNSANKAPEQNRQISDVQQQAAVVEIKSANTANEEYVAVEAVSPIIPENEAENAIVEDLKNLNDFLGYLQQIHDQNEQIVPDISVLEKIVQTEYAPVAKKESQPAIFDDGKIEIYDSEKGVVGVIDETGARVIPETEVQPQEIKSEETNQLDEKAEEHENQVNEAETLKQEDVEAVIEQEEEHAKQTEAEVHRFVQEEINRAKEAGEDAPVVLIPGLQNVAVEIHHEENVVSYDDWTF